MTKKIETLPEPTPPVVDIEDKMYERTRLEFRDQQWLKETALRCAVDFHKNNGGMMTAQQLVDVANTFLNFTQGETK